jgi:hypothetical protein
VSDTTIVAGAASASDSLPAGTAIGNYSIVATYSGSANLQASATPPDVSRSRAPGRPRRSRATPPPCCHASAFALVLSQNGESAADDVIRLTHGDVVVVFAYARVQRHVRVLFEECEALALPVVLCTDTLSLPAALGGSIVIRSGRGVPRRSASHATTVLMLEAIAIALAARRPDAAAAALERLTALRRRLGGRGSRTASASAVLLVGRRAGDRCGGARSDGIPGRTGCRVSEESP